MVVGKYIPAIGNKAETIQREFYGQGMIYKNNEAYDSGLDIVCYIPEQSDSKYTHRDFLAMCNEQEEIAQVVFDSVDWQHPETYVDEQFRNQELAVCEQCHKWYWSYETEICPNCFGRGIKED